MSSASIARIVAAALVLSAAALPAAARDLVVIASNEPALQPGEIVDSNAEIVLPAAGRVTLIGPDGRNLIVQGPYAGRPKLGAASSADDPTLVSRISRLFDASATNSEMPGGVRGLREAEPRDAWSVNVEHNGTYCVAASGMMRLWRAHADAPLEVTLRSAGGSNVTRVQWQSQESEISWHVPADATESRFLLRREGDAMPVVLTLKPIPAELPNDAERAAWMGENGCAAQARRLLQGGG